MYGAAEIAEGGRDEMIGAVTVPLVLVVLVLLLLLTAGVGCLCARGLGFDCRV